MGHLYPAIALPPKAQEKKQKGWKGQRWQKVTRTLFADTAGQLAYERTAVQAACIRLCKLKPDKIPIWRRGRHEELMATESSWERGDLVFFKGLSLVGQSNSSESQHTKVYGQHKLELMG